MSEKKPVSINQKQFENCEWALESALTEIKNAMIENPNNRFKVIAIVYRENSTGGYSTYYRSEKALIEQLGLLELAKKDLCTIDQED